MKKVSPIIQCSMLRWLNEWKRWRDDYDNRALRTNTFFQNFIVTFLTSFAVLLRRFWFYLTFIVFLDLIRRFSTFSMFLRPFSTFLVVFETSLCHFSTSFRRAFAEFFSITPSRLLNRCIDFAWRANCQNQNCCQWRYELLSHWHQESNLWNFFLLMYFKKCFFAFWKNTDLHWEKLYYSFGIVFV